MFNPAVQPLLASQGPDGSWGTYGTGEGRTESTALASLALRRVSLTDPTRPEIGEAAGAGAAWLLERQLDSGAWPVSDRIPGPSWTTALASIALSHFSAGVEAAAEGAEWLLSLEGRGTPWWVRVVLRFSSRRKSVDLDAQLTGWPWVPDTFSWVEPTSYALFAVKRLRPRLPAARVRERIDLAERMLVDRICSDGGWNYGNTRIFGDPLWSYPDTTALAVLAFADRPAQPELGGALEALRRMSAENGSILSLGLTALALGTHGHPVGALQERLTEGLAASEYRETRALAWAALGLLVAPDSTDVSASAVALDPLGIRDA